MLKHLLALFGRRQSKEDQLHLPTDIKTLRKTFAAGKVYVYYWDEILHKEQDLKILNEYNTKLFFFLTSVTTRWLSKPTFITLKPEYQDAFRDMVSDLSSVLDEVSKYITDLGLEQQLTKKLQELAEPVLSSSPDSPDYSSWANSPFSYSEELLMIGQELPLPE